ncbi:MAG: phage regulatory CII family protein [Acidobacteriota bacterium]|nr:phage regulatory CII family protein [Blastocatellia bacterium]MDW8411079.1 phage regulatory CII family protein [Acidobacteriota bacterium]
MSKRVKSTANKEYESVKRALFQLPRKYAGQMRELADAAGISYDRLRRSTSDVETTREGRNLSFLEVLRLIEASGDYSVLYATCAELGFESPRRCKDDDLARKSDCSALVERALELTSATGVLSAAVKAAIADGRISENERREILQAIESVQKQIETLRLIVGMAKS